MERYSFKWFICRQCGHMQGRPARFAPQGLCVRCQPTAEPAPEPSPTDLERDRVARWLLEQAGVL
jgi:hypothetical protein